MSPGPSICQRLLFAEPVLASALPRKVGCRNQSKREKVPKLHPSRKDLGKGNPGVKQTRWLDPRHVYTHTHTLPAVHPHTERGVSFSHGFARRGKKRCVSRKRNPIDLPEKIALSSSHCSQACRAGREAFFLGQIFNFSALLSEVFHYSLPSHLRF